MLEYAQTVEQDCSAYDSKTRSCSQFCLRFNLGAR